jgi:hypothetical protein
MRPEFERTVEGCDYNVRSKFASILNTLHGTVSMLTKLLSMLFSIVCVECVRNGTVSVVTTPVHASQYCVHRMC